MTTLNDLLNAWYVSDDEVMRFAWSMETAGRFVSVDGTAESSISLVLSFFEKPYHWTREYEWWLANDRTDDYEVWEKGEATGWEVK